MILKYEHRRMYIDALCLILFILSFSCGNITTLFPGYLQIIKSPSILLTDYVYIGGLNAALFNVATTLLLHLIILKLNKVEITGPLFAGLMMVVGFSFFGKNILNGLPILIGIWIYSIIKRKPVKNYALMILFSSGLSPIVSYTAFGFALELYYSIPLSIVIGIIVGILIPPFSSHTIQFHQGYNLYNTGFALGIISTAFYGIFILFGLKVESVHLYNSDNQIIFYILLASICLFLIIIAFINDKNLIKNYRNLLKSTGRLLSYFVREYGREAVMLNFAINGIFVMILLVVFKIPMNGIIFGSVISILGISSFGMHIKNTLPVWIGCSIAIVCKMAINNDFTLTLDKDISIIISFLFATGLSPICGRFGIIPGIVAGFLHIAMTPLMIGLQGGFDLYNNGLACGFEAGLLAVVCENVFTKEKRHEKKSKSM